ncbi:MAG: S9 family peptidase, partial [Planctomycetes bacterium]|nr:S9 family peptidase [Planctomycetota bacterium]
MQSLSRSLFIVAILGALPFSADAQKKKAAAYTPAQMMQVKRISGVQVSPDGKRVVYAVREVLLDGGKSETLTHLHLVNADGTGATQLTQGAKSCDEPRWSPDGNWIAFLSAKAGKRNVWLISPKGGDAIQVTGVRSAVTSFRWSPDGAWIAYTAIDGPTPEEEKAKKEKNDARVVDENIKMSRLHIVTLPAAGKKIERALTDGALNVPPAGRSGYDWSPDSKSIVYTRTKTPNADDWTSADLQIVDIETGKSRMLLPSGPVRYAPHFSPDGSSVAFVESDRTWAGSGRIRVYTLGNRFDRLLAPTFDGFGRYSELLGWHPSGNKLIFTEMNGTITGLGVLPLDGDPRVQHAETFPDAIHSGSGVASGGMHLNATRTHVGISWETLRTAPVACYSGLDNFKPIAVSKVNATVPTFPADRTQIVRWKSKDGLEIEGLLTYPANYKKGQRYPLLLNVHGGPAGVFTQTYVGSPGLYPIATFSERGYAVLRPNPRGSSGYGKKFRYANYNDWGVGDFQDLMTGVDHVINMGVADENRLGVMGWSYGGFMTSWTITQTKRFKAASVGAGVTNLMSFTGTADIPSFLPDYFGG